MSEENRTLLVTRSDGEEFQIDIPKDWSVTFGPAAVGIPKVEGKVAMALRIYEGDTKTGKQRAIFCGITSFRDMAIPIRVKKIDIQEKEGFMECDGVRKRTTFQARQQAWVNPDADPETSSNALLNMPQDDTMFNLGATNKAVLEVEV